MMSAYATWTGTKRNQRALREAGWRLLVTPDTLVRDCWRRPLWDDGTAAPYALDNGAWGCFTRGVPWNQTAFERSLKAVGQEADWIVLPDIVGGGLASLERSLSWVDRLEGQLLLPVQDGMKPADLRGCVGGRIGLFIGGTTEWKLNTLSLWGRFARTLGVVCHVGRVNSVRRIAMCASAGAHSFDGTSCTRFSKNVPILDAARRRYTLFYRAPEAGLGQVGQGWVR